MFEAEPDLERLRIDDTRYFACIEIVTPGFNLPDTTRAIAWDAAPIGMCLFFSSAITGGADDQERRAAEASPMAAVSDLAALSPCADDLPRQPFYVSVTPEVPSFLDVDALFNVIWRL